MILCRFGTRSRCVADPDGWYLCVHEHMCRVWLCHGWAHVVGVIAVIPLFASGIQIEARAVFGEAGPKSHVGSISITQRWSLSTLVLGLIVPCSRIESCLVLTVLKEWFWLSFPLAMDFPPHILLQRDRCVWKSIRGTLSNISYDVQLPFLGVYLWNIIEQMLQIHLGAHEESMTIVACGIFLFSVHLLLKQTEPKEYLLPFK